MMQIFLEFFSRVEFIFVSPRLHLILSRSYSLSLSQALAIVGNLALLEDKIDFIVAEGGIPVLLSLVNGVSAQAVWDAQVWRLCGSDAVRGSVKSF